MAPLSSSPWHLDFEPMKTTVSTDSIHLALVELDALGRTGRHLLGVRRVLHPTGSLRGSVPGRWMQWLNMVVSVCSRKVFFGKGSRKLGIEARKV